MHMLGVRDRKQLHDYGNRDAECTTVIITHAEEILAYRVLPVHPPISPHLGFEFSRNHLLSRCSTDAMLQQRVSNK